MSICVNCGNQQESGKFCGQCGLVIPRYEVKRPVEAIAPATATPEPEQSKEYTCPECLVVTTEVFCPTCGIKVRPPKRAEEYVSDGRGMIGRYKCRTCEYMSDGALCPVCGTRLSVD